MSAEDPREWLEPDGLGGYAMGTVDGIRTRRYHGLLLSATKPPDARMLLVADLEVYAETSAGRFALSSHRYRGDFVHPDGATRRTSFDHEPWPRWEYTLPDGTEILYELVVQPGRSGVALRWTQLAGREKARLSVRPLLAGRDYHSLHHENGAFQFASHVVGGQVTWDPYEGVPPIVCASNGAYDHAPDWYRGFLYTVERERGLDCEEDLASPGVFTFDLSTPARMAFGMHDVESDIDGVFAAAEKQRIARPLERAADAYIVRRGEGRTIIAGYPWFADWGRDTFISLRGLCLSTNRRDVAREILIEWTRAIDGGMLPNRFGERDAAPEYNSVDAALWFVIAAGTYLGGSASSEDRAILHQAMDDILDGYTRGTRHGIRADSDGLLACGEPGYQLTWMDAKVDNDVITPRIGKPVEIQALWLNALAIAGRQDACERGRTSFIDRFWNEADQQLYDVIDVDHIPNKVDPSCRPNQIFAVGGLPRPLLTGDRARAVVDRVERDLWSDAGPRSLSPHDPRYQGHYGGAPRDRDRAYHNGPVWPWLAGAFVEAWLRVRDQTPDARREARTRFLEPLLARLETGGLGHLAEIYEGDAPHQMRGCPFQAWSVAELLRIDHLLSP